MTEDTRQLTRTEKLGVSLYALAACLTILVISVCGCATLDAQARATTQPGVSEAIGLAVTAATGNPGAGAATAGGLLAAANLYLFLRGKQYKSAFETVVKTVEPFIPADEPKRAELKAAQGESVTNLVKKAKGTK